jgi:hypothetical protein
VRRFQVGLFVLGFLLLLAAAAFIGEVVGDALWRAGVAALLLDLASMRLWPRPVGGDSGPPA